jgi:hypothetical protein
MAATGNPNTLRDESPRDDVRLFLNRGVPDEKTLPPAQSDGTKAQHPRHP